MSLKSEEKKDEKKTDDAKDEKKVLATKESPGANPAIDAEEAARRAARVPINGAGRC